MKSVTRKAYGKLNLTLDVLGRRPDGYHDMQMIMQTVSLCDYVTVTLIQSGGWICTCDKSNVPADANNLAWKAADTFFAAFGKRPEHLRIHIEKQIPMQGGMAGGSADAAAVLHALNELYGFPFTLKELICMGATVGSDVPYCVLGGTALAEGRGEILTPLKKISKCYFVLVQPDFSVSTPSLFRELDKAVSLDRPNTKVALLALENGDLGALCKNMKNVFQPVLEEQFPIIGELCCKLVQLGAINACLTGTGSVVFGVFTDFVCANAAASKLLEKNFTVYLAENV